MTKLILRPEGQAILIAFGSFRTMDHDEIK